jgi:DNA topoisomerase-1
MGRLRRSDCSAPGITRRGRGKGFEYRDEDGRRIDEAVVLDRIRELGIPSAWRDVWVCADPQGHLQATGYDDAGRKQYLYHPRWRSRRDAEKFDDMARFARALPALRERVSADLEGDGMTRRRVQACALRLLDRGFFRVGSEEYAVQNESYGLATMKKHHVTVEDGVMVFDYPAKSGRRRLQAVVDEDACEIVLALKRRRGGGDELLAYKHARRWRDLRSEDINAYLKEATGDDFSAKDFRTWNGTVLAAMALAVSGEVAAAKTGRKRAISRAVNEVAHYLGNTPAVCRNSYIDPRVFDAHRAGLVIGSPLREAADTEPGELPIHQRELEEAVLDLIDERDRSAALERVAA